MRSLQPSGKVTLRLLKLTKSDMRVAPKHHAIRIQYLLIPWDCPEGKRRLLIHVHGMNPFEKAWVRTESNTRKSVFSTPYHCSLAPEDLAKLIASSIGI